MGARRRQEEGWNTERKQERGRAQTSRMWWGQNGSSADGEGAVLGAATNRPAGDYFERNGWPDPGWPYSEQPALLTGLFAVAVGQVVVIAYHYFHLRSSCPRIQKDVLPPSSFWVDAAGHLSQPEGFFLLGSYLAGTWMFRIMPESYYSGKGGVNFWHVFLQVAVVLVVFVLLSALAASSVTVGVEFLI